MQHKAIVFIERHGETIPAGLLRIIEDGRYSRADFAYGRKYLQRADAVSIDPVQLPLNEDLKTTALDFPLFNGIRDAAPDAWGRSLIDRFVRRRLDRGASEAEFLLASQSGARVGALRFGADARGPGQVLPFSIPDFSPALGDLADFQELADLRSEEDCPERLVDYIGPGTDMGGARPKGTVFIEGQPWLIKFGKASDRIPMAAVEAGCLDLCEMAGINVVQRRVETIAGRPALVLRRFDREEGPDGATHRRHMVSSLTLLGAHENDRGTSSYSDLYAALRQHGIGGSGEDLYRRMVMNVLVGNTDDHYRNHAFLLNDRGRYEMSPLYDVTPTLQMSTSRSLFLHLGRSGDGREAFLDKAVAAGSCLGLQRDQAATIANDLSIMVAAHWEPVMRARGCNDHHLGLIRNSFSEAGRRIEMDDPHHAL